jgi:AcrR family transcriptional regulator
MKADICSAFIVDLEIVGFEEQQLSMCAIPDKIYVLFVIFPSTSEENVMQSGKLVKDRRIQKTQKLLHQALVSLMHEKSYDSIVVKEILARANVGRSTFYTHFRDKDELLVSGIYEMLRSVQLTELPSSAKPYEKIIRFSLPIFEYHDQHRHTGEGGMGIRGRAIVHGHLQKVLAELIANDVRKDFQGQRKTASQIPPELLVQCVASTFIIVLNWWMESRNSLPPQEVNDLFRALITPTLAAALE